MQTGTHFARRLPEASRRWRKKLGFARIGVLGKVLALLGLSLAVLGSPGDERFSFGRAPQPPGPPPSAAAASPPAFSTLSALAGTDTCAEPAPISALPFNDTGTTIGMADNSTGELLFKCGTVGSGPLRQGPDVFYQFTVLGPGNSLTFVLDPTSTGADKYDPAIYVIGICGDLGSCEGGADDLDEGFTETFTLSDLPAGAYYLAVDSTFPVGENDADGEYDLDVTGSFGVAPTATPTNTPTNTPTDTPTRTPTNTPTRTPTNTPTRTPTVTPTSTRTPTPSNTPTPTNTVTGTRTPTLTPTVTPTPTRTPTSTPAPSNTPTVTPTPTITPTPPTVPGFYTVAPCRVADTRDAVGPFGGPALQANTVRSFTIAGRCDVPANATAVALNLTVASPTEPGYLTVFPTGEGLPVASTLNYRMSQVRANNAIIPVGSGGSISVFCGQGSGTTDFLFDVTGFFIGE